METLAVTFALITNTFSLPAGLIQAICFTESGYNVHAIHLYDGATHSYGVCQIKIETARFLGFKGTERQLLKPETNVYYAGKYLRYQLNRYSGNRYKAIAAYNAGTFNPSSVMVGKAKNHKYVSKVMIAWNTP